MDWNLLLSQSLGLVSSRQLLLHASRLLLLLSKGKCEGEDE